MSKFFIVNPNGNPLSTEEITGIEEDKKILWDERNKEKESINLSVLSEKSDLKSVSGRVVVVVDVQAKNWHTFENGVKIRRERDFNDFNRRVTQPSNATVVSADNVPEGAEILISHNALHEVNRIYNYKKVSGKDEATDIRYYSLPETDCFAWFDKEKGWQPMRNFAFGLRVFEPYKGTLMGIEPKKIKDVLYITTGELKGNVVLTLVASDYEIVFKGKEKNEERLIRCRHFENEDNEKQEIIAISHSLTEKVNKGELLVGLEPLDAKKLNK